jgi:hypothetical protein
VQRFNFFVALLFAIMCGVMAPAGAADMSVSYQNTRPDIWRFNRHGKELPFPRDARAQAVWGERACRTDCQSYCTWGEAACLARDPQGHCLKVTDRCDRMCQRECRTRGGPLVPDIFDF